ncbi:MAG: nuclear transport factor 2 family protein [Pseudomonadota bacterium]
MAFSTDSDPEIKATIRAMLNQQVDAWNAGNIDGFMAHYWRDPDVRFASGGDVKRGWQRVLDQYRERYPDRSAMGVLTTREIDVTLLSPEEGYVFGRWIVTAKGEDFCGLFTLVVRDINNQWVIVHDHTSMSAGPAADGRSCSDIKAS